MKYRWIDKNVETSDVEEAAESFLHEKGFKLAPLDSKDSKKMMGILESTEGRKKVIITINGEARDFTVDFATSETAQMMGRLASTITSFFGGGPLQLKSLKEKEYYQKLEDQFWEYLEEFISEKSKS